MKYLHIISRGGCDRLYFEKFLSNKREGKKAAASIGQFGSGAKYAPVAAMRLGIEVFVSSQDASGRYFLTYGKMPLRIGNNSYEEISFRYRPVRDDGTFGEAFEKASGWELASFPHGDDPLGDDETREFHVLSEYLCNAADEDPEFRISWSDRPMVAEPGTTAVTLSYTTGIHRLLANVRRYFKFLSKEKPLFAAEGVGAIYAKSEPAQQVPDQASPPKVAMTRLFSQGMLVFCSRSDGHESLFDYSVTDKANVSGDRELRSYGKCCEQIARLFERLTNTDLIEYIVLGACAHRAKVEESAMVSVANFSPEAKAAWRKAVERAFGDRVITSSMNRAADERCEKVFGYRVVGDGFNGLHQLLRVLGYPSVRDVTPTQENMRYDELAYDELDGQSRADFEWAFARLAEDFPSRTQVPIGFCLALSANIKDFEAFCGIGTQIYQETWIVCASRTSIGKTREKIYQCLFHEGRHCETRAEDLDPKFREQADQDVITVKFGPRANSPAARPAPLLLLPTRPPAAADKVDPHADTVPVFLTLGVGGADAAKSDEEVWRDQWIEPAPNADDPKK